MLDAAREAQSFIHNQSRRTLDSNRMLALSLLRSIEVIGEAAAQTTDEFQAAHPHIPWPKIIAMRNRLIHAYFDIDVALVWETTIDVLPSFVSTIKEFLNDEDPTLFSD